MRSIVHHDHGQFRRILARVAIAAAVVLTPATALAAPAFAAPVVLQPATQDEAQPSFGAPIHRGGGSHHLSHRGGGSHHLSHGGSGSSF